MRKKKKQNKRAGASKRAIKSEMKSNWGINQTIESRQKKRLQALKVLGERIYQ